MFRTHRFRRFCVLLVVVAATAPLQRSAAEDPIDILWYGNSFTNATCCGSSRSVPNIFLDVATAAGHVAPRNRNASADGQTLQWHLTNNTSVITTGIVAGEKWEFVVLQDYSTWPTHIGNLPQHLSSTLALYQKVAMHSPNVIPVEYQTWARGYGHSYYSGANPDFPGGPAQMEQELRDGYHMSVAGINAAVGSNLARLAPAGDAWEDANFPANFYGDGNYHASNRGSLLNALVLYGTIYGDPTTSDIDLSTVLTRLNLTAADGALVTGLADGVLAVPEPAAGVVAAAGILAVALRRRGAARN
jgi:hypothetical protein